MLVAKLSDVYASVAVLAFAVLPLIFGLPSDVDTSSVLVKSVCAKRLMYISQMRSTYGKKTSV